MKYKILTTLGLVLLILITFVWTAPYLFKGKITRLAKARISSDLKAHVSFSDVDISWFRNFPKLAVGFNDLQVTGVGEFEADTLLVAKQFDVACNPVDLVSGDSLRIYSLTLSKPHLHARMLRNGHRNWDIMKSELSSETPAEAASRSLKLVMQQYAVHNGYIKYEDEGRGVTFEMDNVEQEGKGNFNSDFFTLKTMTTAEAVQFKNGGTVPYQLGAKAKIEASIKIDRKTNTFSFNTDRISFNDLKLHADGFFQWINDSSYNMNIRFRTATTEFKNILSLLSPVYERDFASVKSTGLVVFNGFVKGKYNAKGAPAYHVNLDVENGFFQYPDLPLSVKNINLSLHVDNPDGLPDHVLVDIRNGHVEINNDSLDFHLLVKNPKTKPYIDMALAGRMDLANISRLMKLKSGTRLSGLVSANLFARGNSTSAEKHGKDLRAGGQFDLSNFLYVSNDYPGGIVLTQLLMTLSAKNALINELTGAYLSTHFSATGTFNNLFDFAMRNNPLKASISLKADEINLRDWMGAAKDSTGSLTHVHTTFKVPAGIDFTIQAEADKLHYDNLDMQHLSGAVVISDETLQFDQVRAEALEGTMVINGTYSTKEGTENPEIALTYDVNGVDVQKTFFAFNTMQKLMPVGKFMSGKFNSHLSFAGQLGPDMMPNLHGLHGEGNIVLTGGTLKDFGPLDKLSQLLDIHELKNVSLENVNADFTFESGKVVVNSFQVHTGDIDMEIFGTHSFDQSLEYGINLKVPRNQLGSKGTTFVKNVVTEAADKGIPVRLNDAVNIYVKMTGTINSPEIKTDMNAVVDQSADVLKKEVDDFVNAKLDSAKQQLRHPSSTKKQALAHSSHKARINGTTKKVFVSEHKKFNHSKKKKSIKHYSTSLKKGKSVASTGGKK